MMREERENGFFIALDYSCDELTQVSSFFKQSGKDNISLTVHEILDEEIARELV